MKHSLTTLLPMLAAGILMYFNILPWWSLAPIGAILGFFSTQTPKAGFATGMATGTALWTTAAIWISTANGGVLAGKVGQLFMGLQGWQLITVTGLIGGLLGGMGVLTGVLGRNAFGRKVQ